MQYRKKLIIKSTTQKKHIYGKLTDYHTFLEHSTNSRMNYSNKYKEALTYHTSLEAEQLLSSLHFIVLLQTDEHGGANEHVDGVEAQQH